MGLDLDLDLDLDLAPPLAAMAEAISSTLQASCGLPDFAKLLARVKLSLTRFVAALLVCLGLAPMSAAKAKLCPAASTSPFLSDALADAFMFLKARLVTRAIFQRATSPGLPLAADSTCRA